ncbi:hypothetical protein ACFQZC_00145 [Streptacidiphilus monticola]
MADTMPRPAHETGTVAGGALGPKLAAALRGPGPAAVTAPVPGAVAAVPQPAPAAVSGRAGVLPVGFDVIEDLRGRVAAQLSEESLRGENAALSAADVRQLGLRLVKQVVAEWATHYATTVRLLSGEEEQAIRAAVVDALFRAGRLQPLLDDPAVENILIDGCDQVFVDYVDRPAAPVAPIAGSDSQLVNLINQLARNQGQGERALTPATPNLNLRLADGSRLAASYLVTPARMW